MDFFYKLDYKEIVVLSSILTLILAEDKSADELNILGNFIVSLGGNLLTIAAVKQVTSDKNSSTNNNSPNNNNNNNNNKDANKDTLEKPHNKES